jgi:hypothetical protein
MFCEDIQRKIEKLSSKTLLCEQEYNTKQKKKTDDILLGKSLYA